MRVIEKQVLWKGKFIQAVKITYLDHNGQKRTWEAVQRVNCGGITIIVPVTKQKELILVRQFRPVIDNFVIELPAGLNNPGESPIETALRELIEETRYKCDSFTTLISGPVSPGISTEVLTVLLANEVYPATPEELSAHPPDDTENIEVIKTPLVSSSETIEKYRQSGDYIDLKVYGIVEIAKRYLQV